MGEGARRHRTGHGLADRAVTQQRVPRHAQHFTLGFVGIGDEAALDDVRGAGDGRQGSSDQSTGARFGSDDLELARATGDQHVFRGRPQFTIEHTMDP